MSRENQVQWKRGGAGEGEKGKNVEKFLCRTEFPNPINHISTLSQNLPFLSTPPAPTLNNFHVGSQESLRTCLHAISLSPFQYIFYIVARASF